jgi:hypothetical protein
VTLLNPFRFGAETDPYWDQTVSLLHFNGSDASTTFTDESGKTWTVNGNAQIDTAQSKFGGASGLFDGNGDYLSVGADSDFDFGTGDFTIECWLRRNSFTQHYQGILASGFKSYASGANTFLAFGNNSAVNVNHRQRVALGGYDLDQAGANILTAQLSLNVWYHVAATRAGNTLRVFLNGNLEAQSTYAGALNFNVNDETRIGSNRWDGSNGYLNGWLDDLRVTKGAARYTRSFVPRGSPYPDS